LADRGHGPKVRSRIDSDQTAHGGDAQFQTLPGWNGDLPGSTESCRSARSTKDLSSGKYNLDERPPIDRVTLPQIFIRL
jgi:hypothetical protein